jgi:hypothetical protein
LAVLIIILVGYLSVTHKDRESEQSATTQTSAG